MRVVILGCGRVGAHLAKMLAAEGHQVTVIDKNSAAFARLGAGFSGNMVMGTGIDEDVLRRAGIEQAEAFVAVTNGDNTNVMSSQVAKEIFGVPRVVCRIYDPLREEIYRTLGLETICPTLWGATKIKEILES
ncbi:MAG: potassium channel family protein [Anaerolineae bacterium]